jgi:phospholipase C
MDEQRLTRRRLLGTAAAAAVGSFALDPVIQRALASGAPRRGSLADIEHVVILMQENRSFDHYFGTFPGVRGFGDRAGHAALTQTGFPVQSWGSKLLPFHLGNAPQCLPDITHDWGPQHRSWNSGLMNRFAAEHIATDGAAAGPATMGYMERQDIPFYWALAQAFTLCDRYHCSVMGPTDPNRLMSMSATLDPAGAAGGPLLETLVAKRAAQAGTFTWTTMPEQLRAHGVSWKVYTSPAGGIFDNVLPYFHAFQADPSLAALGTTPAYPADFVDDLAHGTLPQVSWLLTSLVESEHPGYSAAKAGEYAARQVLSALTAHPSIWARTALFITWDENGGFFDHVPPPAAPAGTPGEYVTTPVLPAAAQGIAGPLGLGFRVPMIVASPFSRGGFVCSDVLDHTSILRFLERRFGAEVPNLSAWRRGATGDLTGAFAFSRAPDTSVPRLPAVKLTSTQLSQGVCTSTNTKPYPVPEHQSLPHQLAGRARRP